MTNTIKIKATFVDQNEKGRYYIKDGLNTVYFDPKDYDKIYKGREYEFEYEEMSNFNGKFYYFGKKYTFCTRKGEEKFKYEGDEEYDKLEESKKEIRKAIETLKKGAYLLSLHDDIRNELTEYVRSIYAISEELIEEAIIEQNENGNSYTQKNDIRMNDVVLKTDHEFDDDMPF